MALCLGCSLNALAQNQLKTLQLPVPDEVLSGFEDYEVVSLDHQAVFAHYKSGDNAIKLDFTTSAGPLSFDLQRWDQRGDNHRLLIGGGTKHGKIMPRLPAAQYSGLERSAGGGRAVFTLDEAFIMGSWQHNGQKMHLEPLFRLWPAAPRNAYLLYRAEDVKPISDACSITTPPGVTIDHTESENKSIGECFEVQIALAADFEIFQVFGSAASVQNFMLGVLADVQTNYDDEFEDEIQFIVSATEIFTTDADDPWTNSTDVDDLLNSFSSWGNSGGFSNTYDVASLWSQRDFDGPTIGYASVRALCSFGRYNILQNFSNNANSLRVLWAHELGHNFGSSHDDNGGFIMAASVNGSSQWSAQSINAITAHYQSVNCLSSCTPPDPPQADVVVADNDVCAGSQVAFFNETTERFDETSWSFPGGTPSSSDESHPIITYATPGNYTATMTVSNQFGSSQQSTNITVNEVAEASRTIIFYDNFEVGARFMTVDNPDNNFTWQLATFEGNKGSFAAFIDNFNNNGSGQSDFLQTPPLNLNGLAAPRLEFEYAFRRYNAGNNDELRVLVSIDGGPADVIFTGRENGSQNFATGPDLKTVFIPQAEDDWCGPASGQGCISLDLSAYVGETNVVISLENINDFGNTLLIDNVTVFGNCTAALPVEWLNFTARATGKNARLNWEVNQDDTHAGFFVERSSDGEANWLELGWVPSNEQRSTTASYNFTDENIGLSQTYYYRLRQRDQNGEESLSEVRTVSFPLSTGVAVWPNPTGGLLEVRNGISIGNFQLFNALGQRVLTGKLAEGNTSLDLSLFVAGVYFLRVDAGEEEQVFRIVRK